MKLTALQIDTLALIRDGKVEQHNHGHGAWRIHGANPSVVGRLVSLGLARWTKVIGGRAEPTDAGRDALPAFGGELPEIDGLRWLRPGGLMPNVIRAETAAGDYYITNGDRIAVSGPLNRHYDTVEDAVSAVARHHAARITHDEIRRLQGALRGVQNPLEYLRRYAASEGTKLNGNAYAIANDLGFVQRIAREALEDPTDTKGQADE